MDGLKLELQKNILNFSALYVGGKTFTNPNINFILRLLIPGNGYSSAQLNKNI